ncbi:MAG: hypothetical protein EXS13_07160 [Planctomycetes bacterium]|nr:hypothetical protein [Planctomycetota bacterium]
MAKELVMHAEEERQGRGAPIESMADPLLDSAADAAFFSPHKPASAAQHGYGPSSNAAMWFFGAVVTGLLVVQTLQLFSSRYPDPAAPPTHANPTNTAPQEGHDSSKGAEIDRLLYESRIGIDRGVYETAIRLLEPLLEQPHALSKSERSQTYLLLSQAHRAMDNIPRAQKYYLLAIDQSIDRHEPALILEDASELRDDGRFAESRQKLCALLARRDGLDKKGESLATLAAARVADTWYAQAVATGQLAPLPSLTAEAKR